VTGASEVQSAELDGNVVLFEEPAAKAGAQLQPPLRATAGKVVYEGQGEWLHLTMSPRVVNGGMELTAEKVDVSQQSGDAFAHGNVKATWTGAAVGGAKSAAGNAGGGGAEKNDSGGGVTLGGKGPAHVVAAEAELNQSSGEATFRGHARLWQQTNFVSGPVIVLSQHLQTLVARSGDPAEPVRVVMLSASAAGSGKGAGAAAANGNSATQTAGQVGVSNVSAAASVIRVRGGELRYSDAERRAMMHGGTLGAVVAETGTATSSSDAVELLLMPVGNHDASGAPGQSGQAQVDRMTATGHVSLTSQGRRGTGEQLVYTGATGEYVLTGSAGAPPKMSDPERGTVTGEALIFDSRDDRVRVEGGGRETETDTTAPDAHGK
jgi:lipopolysaccharide export system protein LptA